MYAVKTSCGCVTLEPKCSVGIFQVSSLFCVHHHSMQILSCCSRYELRHWLNWRCPQTAEVQTCCVFLRVQYDRWMWHFVVSCGTQQLHMTVGSICYFCVCCSFPFKSFVILYLISTVCCLYFTMILSLDSQVMLHIVYYTCVLSVYYTPDTVHIRMYNFWTLYMHSEVKSFILACLNLRQFQLVTLIHSAFCTNTAFSCVNLLVKFGICKFRWSCLSILYNIVVWDWQSYDTSSRRSDHHQFLLSTPLFCPVLIFSIVCTWSLFYPDLALRNIMPALRFSSVYLCLLSDCMIYNYHSVVFICDLG